MPHGPDILSGYPSSVQYPIMASYGNMPFSWKIVKPIMNINPSSMADSCTGNAVDGESMGVPAKAKR
jgi:hypothetical protein